MTSDDGPIPQLAPQGVEVVHRDGTRVPVELEFHGTARATANGQVFYQWKIAADVEWQLGDALEADSWPSCALVQHPAGGWIAMPGASGS